MMNPPCTLLHQLQAGVEGPFLVPSLASMFYGVIVQMMFVIRLALSMSSPGLAKNTYTMAKHVC